MRKDFFALFEGFDGWSCADAQELDNVEVSKTNIHSVQFPAFLGEELIVMIELFLKEETISGRNRIPKTTPVRNNHDGFLHEGWNAKDKLSAIHVLNVFYRVAPASPTKVGKNA